LFPKDQLSFLAQPWFNKISYPDLPDAAVRLQGLTKLYRARGRQAEKLALDNVTLTIPRGSFFALLGPNGAGKSTMINILAGLVNKSAGSASIWGFDSVTHERQARSAIGVVPQELNLDPFFTPRELLEVQAGLYGVPAAERRTDEILSALGLADKAHAYARSLSGGMRRRLLVAKAMVHSPPVLVLDEPTAGVDIDLRRQLWDYVKELNRLGTTVLLTTHYLEEAEMLCDRVAIIDRGRLVAHDETRVMLGQLDSKILTVTIDRDITQIPASLAGFAVSLTSRRRLAFNYKPSRDRVGEILAALQAADLAITDVSTEEADLEDIFLRLTHGQPSAP
jgi:ABC-2 type transport system ATP-binding protein